MTSICIDGYNLALPKGSGIATYARTLIAGIRDIGLDAEVLHGSGTPMTRDLLLREISVEDALIKTSAPALFKPNRAMQVAFAGLGRNAYRVHPSGQILWPNGSHIPPADNFWLSENLFRIANTAFSKSRTVTPVRFSSSQGAYPPSLMHWTYPVPLQAKGVPNIYTFHDLIPLKLPHTTLDDKRRYLDLCRVVVKRADHIVAVSETTRRDLISMLGVEKHRITTTWQTADLSDEALARSDEAVANGLVDTFGLDWKSYFIFFGAIEPKKNVARLIQAYLRSGVHAPLLIVGGTGWLNDEDVGFLNEVIASPGPGGQRIHRYDYLPKSVLTDLVRGARATLFPSLYEGFGLPVLESMMLGAPVLASDAGSLPEITGGATLMVNPYDVEDMARGIRTLDADDDLRGDLTTRGLARAAYFSPDAYAARLKALYLKVGVT